jgi:hypothetical protein
MATDLLTQETFEARHKTLQQALADARVRYD